MNGCSRLGDLRTSNVATLDEHEYPENRKTSKRAHMGSEKCWYHIRCALGGESGDSVVAALKEMILPVGRD